MSLILDALRRGRVPETIRPNSNPSQTDQVLQTLGYVTLDPASSVKRRRLVVYVFLGLTLGVAILGAVFWLTIRSRPHGVPMAVSKAPSVAAPSAGVDPVPVRPPATPPPSPVSTSAGPGVTGALPIVQDSRQPDVPATLPAPDADHFRLALYHQRSGDFENALLQYRAVLQRDELNAEAHNNLGLLYRDKGLHEEAVREFVRAIAINQRYVKAHNNLGVTYLSQRKSDAAAVEFQTALRIDPRNVESLVNLSLAQRDTANVDLARGSLTQALEIDPRSAEAHYNLALMADEAGDRALALTHYRAFLQYGNEHPELVPQVRARLDVLSR
jgi:Tfp pilus assembly protein PilF